MQTDRVQTLIIKVESPTEAKVLRRELQEIKHPVKETRDIIDSLDSYITDYDMED